MSSLNLLHVSCRFVRIIVEHASEDFTYCCLIAVILNMISSVVMLVLHSSACSLKLESFYHSFCHLTTSPAKQSGKQQRNPSGSVASKQ